MMNLAPVKRKLPEKFLPRLIMTVAGVSLCSIAIAFFKCSLFGVDPFQCFAQGLWGRFLGGFSYGTYYIGLSLLMLAVDLFLARRYIGLATFVNLFLTGYIVDFFQALLNHLFPDPGLPVRAGLLVIGVLLMCFSSSLYMTSNLGVSVYDAIPIVLSEKIKKPFRFCRIGCDLICTLVGALCGLLPGLGTLITALFMGPLIEFFNVTFSRPILYGKQAGADRTHPAPKGPGTNS